MHGLLHEKIIVYYFKKIIVYSLYISFICKDFTAQVPEVWSYSLAKDVCMFEKLQKEEKKNP